MSEGEASFIRTWAHDVAHKLFDKVLKIHKAQTPAIPTPNRMSDNDHPTQQRTALHPRMGIDFNRKIAFIDGDGWYAQPLVDGGDDLMDATAENIAKIEQFLNGTNWDSTTSEGDRPIQQPRLHPWLLIDENGKIAFIDREGSFCQPLVRDTDEIMDATNGSLPPGWERRLIDATEENIAKWEQRENHRATYDFEHLRIR
jgi:hypothetical protein